MNINSKIANHFTNMWLENKHHIIPSLSSEQEILKQMVSRDKLTFKKIIQDSMVLALHYALPGKTARENIIRQDLILKKWVKTIPQATISDNTFWESF